MRVGATGGTIEAAVKGLVDAGCKPDITVAATHLLLVDPAATRLQPLPIRQLIGSDSVRTATRLPIPFQVVHLAPLIADAISRLHRDQSLAPILAHA